MTRISREAFSSNFFHNMVQGINKEYIFQKKREKTKYKKYHLKQIISKNRERN